MKNCKYELSDKQKDLMHYIVNNNIRNPELKIIENFQERLGTFQLSGEIFTFSNANTINSEIDQAMNELICSFPNIMISVRDEFYKIHKETENSRGFINFTSQENEASTTTEKITCIPNYNANQENSEYSTTDETMKSVKIENIKIETMPEVMSKQECARTSQVIIESKIINDLSNIKINVENSKIRLKEKKKKIQETQKTNLNQNDCLKMFSSHFLKYCSRSLNLPSMKKFKNFTTLNSTIYDPKFPDYFSTLIKYIKIEIKNFEMDQSKGLFYKLAQKGYHNWTVKRMLHAFNHLIIIHYFKTKQIIGPLPMDFPDCPEKSIFKTAIKTVYIKQLNDLLKESNISVEKFLNQLDLLVKTC